MAKYDKGLHIEIGKQLKEARIKKGMSLQNMSDAIGGIKTKQSIMRYENGESRIDEPVMERMCNVLGLNVNEVVRSAELQRVLNTEYHLNVVGYDVQQNAAKLAQIVKAKVAKDQLKDDVAFAYEHADEKTQRAVRILLGLE